jgi:sugar transferase (PEP-CTERM/EpsH1 system associated)
MRILFLAHRIPYPPNKGDKIRAHRALLALRQQGDVHVACFLDDARDEQHVPALQSMCTETIVVRLAPFAAKARALAAALGGQSLSLAHYRSPEMRRRLGAIGAVDAVFAFSSVMAPYALEVPARCRILDLCDLDSMKWAQYGATASFPMAQVYRAEARRLGAYEADAAGRFDVALLISAAEAAVLRDRAPDADVRVLRNGVELGEAAPDARGDGRTLVFCGHMDYFVNIDAVVHFHDEILPRIRREVPGARFRIVGANPAPRVRALARTEGVEVTGWVDDVRAPLLASDVSVAPLRLGRGVPNKVLEALALALPVVATANAVAGLDLAGFDGVDVVDDPDAFAAAAVRRLREAQRFPDNRTLLAERYSWSSFARELGEIVRGARRAPECAPRK